MQFSEIRQDDRRAVRLADALQRHMSSYGYRIIETPVIQAADLFLTKAGDQIINRLFTFERSGRHLALRPEFTATAAHYYATHHQQGITRWQFNGAIFEDDPSRSDHHYQKLSVGAELIGLEGVLADSEIIAMAVEGLKSVGITDGRLMLGHAGLTRSLLRRFHLNTRTEHFLLNHLGTLKAEGKAAVLAQIEELLPVPSSTPAHHTSNDSNAQLNTQQMLDAFLDATQSSATMGGRSREDIVRRLLQKRQRVAEHQHILQAVDLLDEWVNIRSEPAAAFTRMTALVAGDPDAQAVLAYWQGVLNLLEVCGISAESITIQPSLARSWDYYTGLVFEITSGDGRHLAGGGRYDELIRLVNGNTSVPAVGFVYYPDHMLQSIPDLLGDEDETVVIIVETGAESAALRWAQVLRARHIPVMTLPAGYWGEQNVISVRITAEDAEFAGAIYRLNEADRLAADLKMKVRQP